MALDNKIHLIQPSATYPELFGTFDVVNELIFISIPQTDYKTSVKVLMQCFGV